MYLQTPGFILKHRNNREVDRVYTIYTVAAGKLEIGARGVRKIQSKLRGHLRPFAEVDFDLVRGRQRYQLIGAQVAKNFQFSMLNFQTSIGYGYYFLEIIDKLTREQQRNDEVFGLLQEGLAILAETMTAENSFKKLRVTFLLKILKATGYNPEKRVPRLPAVQQSLEAYLHGPMKAVLASETESLKTLFNISQYTLSEALEQPLRTVKFLRTL